MELETERTAVIVVDCQNDFCHPDGALYAPASEEAIDGVNEVLDATSGTVYYTYDTHEEDDPEFEQWGEHCLNGSWGHELHEDVDKYYPTQVVQKDTYDAFHETKLHERLQRDDIDTLVICGTLVNVCVQETASSAALHGYDVYVVEDAVGYLEEDQKQAALDHIDFLIGETISIEDLR